MAKAKKLKSGRWNIALYDYTDTNGKRHYKSFTSDTKKEVEFLAAEYKCNRKGRTDTYDDMTLKEAYDRYIKMKSSILSPSTIAGYERSKRNHFQMLMHVKLSKLTQNMITVAINELAADHSPKTVRNAHGLLSAVLKTYYPQLHLNTTLPQKIKPKFVIPSTNDIKTVLEHANDIIRVPVLLASQGSLRRSEICALKSSDFTNFGVNITKAAVEDDNNNVVIKTTKTEAGTRFVPLSEDVINECRAWQYFGISPAKLTSEFKKLIKASGVEPFSFHKLRHYFASYCHENGIPDKQIARIGGWSDVSVLQRIYEHALKENQSKAEQKVINIFSSAFQDDERQEK